MKRKVVLPIAAHECAIDSTILEGLVKSHQLRITGCARGQVDAIMAGIKNEREPVRLVAYKLDDWIEVSKNCGLLPAKAEKAHILNLALELQNVVPRRTCIFLIPVAFEHRGEDEHKAEIVSSRYLEYIIEPVAGVWTHTIRTTHVNPIDHLLVNGCDCYVVGTAPSVEDNLPDFRQLVMQG